MPEADKEGKDFSLDKSTKTEGFFSRAPTHLIGV